MLHFPVFLNVQNKRILVTGAGETAIAKLRLLLKSEGNVIVFATEVHDQVESWAKAGLLQIIRREIRMDDFYNTAMVYAAEDDPEKDGKTAAKAKMVNVLFNIVDNLQESEFITPAIVDRDPVTIAIGTEGTAPVLARKIKSEIEESLPNEIGLLARIGNRFRSKASTLPEGRPRRRFWKRYFYEHGPKALRTGGEKAVRQTLNALYDQTTNEAEPMGKVFLVGAGPGDPDLLTRKAAKILHEADVVIHDRLVSPQVLELARREAVIVQTGKQGFGPSWKQDDINALMVEHASRGAQIVRLKSGDPVIFGRLDEEMSALDDAGIEFEIIPGITTASAAAANLNVSLTKRQRNSALQILTAQDVNGFAEQEWRTLAREGSVAAVYMGLKSARFLSGRLLMHGASKQAPVTIIENVSRPDQKIVAATIGNLAELAEQQEITGPAILMLGLEPRAARRALERSEEKLAEAGAI